MKKYIIITPSIINMGGAQMYIRNKLLYMQNCGWVANIFSSQKGEVCISELRSYNIIFPELGLPYYLFPRRKRDALVQSLVNRILDSDYEDIVIESTCMAQSTWAEVIAENCNARHLTYLLQESNQISSQTLLDFFVHKYQRHELAGINDRSIFDMFESFSPISMEQSKKCHLPAFCTNVVEDIDSEWMEKIKARHYDYLVGCLSRLDKPFIIPALKDFVSYASAYPDKRFLLVLLGGAPEGSRIINNIKEIFYSITNVELIITGYMFPISTRLLALFNVFFTSAGSSWVCMRSGIPTISIDGNDCKPIGILGRTTNNSLFRGKDEPPLTFKVLMDDILFNDTYVKQDPQHILVEPDFSSHNIFLLNLLSNERKYFSFVNVRLDCYDKKRALILSIIGAERYFKFRKVKKMIKSHTIR